MGKHSSPKPVALSSSWIQFSLSLFPLYLTLVKSASLFFWNILAKFVSSLVKLTFNMLHSHLVPKRRDHCLFH
jgi:hypothetical protein